MPSHDSSMSEYQLYEFVAVDRPLTSAQRRQLRDISSRAEITASSFRNEYNYGEPPSRANARTRVRLVAELRAALT